MKITKMSKSNPEIKFLMDLNYLIAKYITYITTNLLAHNS